MQIPSQITSRISFIQHNFLTELPLQKASFDFVRLAYVSLGVPGQFMRWYPRSSQEIQTLI